MSIPRSVADVIQNHVTLEAEGIDRIEARGAAFGPAESAARFGHLHVRGGKLAPDADETTQNQLNQFPVTEVFSHIEVADGRVWMLPEGVRSFAGDLSEDEQKVVWATHFAPAADLYRGSREPRRAPQSLD